ncbi:heterokaryon incompatibility protein-domain-containing protein [Dactylonectria estremocensis]|uniref:Heterokaryon incompatibility protein-domain-containing protein n=1 Tax=Dactylonectria estremocensis TaxID=1079267 RepID=A0A9P9JGD5_9HYPO|nr:heterokaryon incompatibility protein-domain-containing protein [Dactylonectria estremocensis]
MAHATTNEAEVRDELYRSIPIDSSRQEFRLLLLHPGAWQTPIQCSLSVASLRSRPKFRALSYVWGRKTSSHSVQINNRRLSVWKNLEGVLQRLRRDIGGEDVRLWIDAVCINQNDDEERNAQVAMMANIYTSCQEVFVWLGECELPKLFPGPIQYLSRNAREEARQLLDKYVLDFRGPTDMIDYSFHLACLLHLLKDSPNWKRDKTVDFTSHSQPPYWTRVGREAHMRGDVPRADFRIDEYADGLQLALQTLRRSTWFTRIWVLQEYAFAPRVILGFGTAAIFLDEMPDLSKIDIQTAHPIVATLASMITIKLGTFTVARNAAAYFKLPASRFPGLRILIAPLHPLLAWLRKYVLTKVKTTLFDVCVEVRAFDSTDPRDKVFTVVLFMKYIGLKVPLDIDYRVPAETVYQRVCEDHVESCTNHPYTYEPLAPLRFSRDKNKVKDLPSWVVDWTSYGSGSNGHASGSGRLTFPRLYSANKGMPGIEPKVEFGILTVSGAQVDAVETVIDLSVDGRQAWHTVECWLGAQVPTTDAKDWSDESAKARQVAMLRTLCVDISPSTWEWWTSNWTEFADLMRGSCSEAEGDASLADIARGASISLQDIQMSEPQHALSAAPNIFIHIALQCQDTALFHTEHGFFGMGGQSIRPGHSVWVLDGGRTPFVLSKAHEPHSRYQVVSECFVHGFMYGEVANKEVVLGKIQIE